MANEGLALKIRRISAGITQREVAEAMGVKHQHVSIIEAKWRLAPKTRERYLTAFAALVAKREAVEVE